MPVKRPFIALLTVIYFAVSSGIVIDTHYCMGKLFSVQLNAFGKKSCGCGVSEENSCCKTELKVFKVDDVQQPSYADFALPLNALPLSANHSVFDAAMYTGPADLYANGHSPPLLLWQDTYLQNCVFRI